MSGKEQFTVSAKPREATGSSNSRRLRREGFVPVVVYSHGQDGKKMSIPFVEAQALLQHTGLAFLQVEGQKDSVTAIVKDSQVDVLTSKIIHMDLQEVRADETIISTVVLEPVGDPVGVSEGGILEQSLHELEISCRATDLPDAVEVDVSGIAMGDSLYVRDVTVPENVEVTEDPDLVVFHVSEPRPEEEEEAAEEIEALETEEPELIRKGKGEEEGEEE